MAGRAGFTIETKILTMGRLGIPPISDHLSKMPELANPINADLSTGFTVPGVAEKHACPVGPEDHTGGWAEPMVWSIAFEKTEP